MLLGEICLVHLLFVGVLCSLCAQRRMRGMFCVCVCVSNKECVLCMLFWTVCADSAAQCGTLRRRMFMVVESSHLLTSPFSCALLS